MWRELAHVRVAVAEKVEVVVVEGAGNLLRLEERRRHPVARHMRECRLADLAVGDVLLVEKHAREHREEHGLLVGRLARRLFVLVEVVLCVRMASGERALEQVDHLIGEPFGAVAEHRDERGVTALGSAAL